MNKPIQKIITCEVKEVADRTLEFIGSSETRDRMGDIVRADGWQLENYMKNPVFLWAHQYDQPPIGKATRVWVENRQLKFDIQFATRDEYEFADTIYRLYKGGYLRATSVGFKPTEYRDIKDESGYGTEFIKQELLELSACPVPANPDALVSARAAGLISVKEYEALTRSDRPKTPTQSEIKDEIDYLKTLIERADFNADNLAALIDLGDAIRRLTGADIPDDDIKPAQTPAVMQPTQEQIAAALQIQIEKQLERALARVRGKI